MCQAIVILWSRRLFVVLALGAFCLNGCAETAGQASGGQIVTISAAEFKLGTHTFVGVGTNRVALAVADMKTVPFSQSAVKQSPEPALLGPNPKIPYFTVRFAMPIPPENATSTVAVLTGMDPMVFTHNHSPGFEILPNGDALAVYFSTPPGKAEADVSTSFVQARLRYGAEEWDMPELFFKTQDHNDQSGLLWVDKNKIWFFGGGRGLDSVPFRMATSTDNGATWTISLPQLETLPEKFTAQPITSAFRGANGFIYFGMDGDGASSFLWRSDDDGIHWRDMGGRTGGRHSVIVPVGDKGNLLSIGGKNNSIDGWSPENVSTDWGASWSSNTPSPFPPLGSAQRPSLIRLADGNLFFVSDAYLQKKGQAPPEGWKYGNDCFVAISTNNGASWRIKPLPVQLPNHEYRKYGTVGYVTARQAPNGVIHVLTTETQPCAQYELNEAWIFSDAGDVAPETSGGEVRKFSEKYPNGKSRATWSARICPNGRYLLDGLETDYYETGQKAHEVTYGSGRKTGTETYWSTNGAKLWTWESHPESNTAIWTQYWNNGKKHVESHWETQPKARDLDRSFFGFVANGPATQWNEDGTVAHVYNFVNGQYDGESPVAK